MAGTRLLISSIVLFELVFLACWSYWYGLCRYPKDDVLCPRYWTFNESSSSSAASDSKPSPLSAPPSFLWWAQSTLNLHLIVEREEEESSSSLQTWALRLQEWLDESQLSEWSYFGSLQVHMQVVVPNFYKNNNNNKNVENVQLLWDSLDLDYQNDSDSAENHQGKNHHLDWVLYIPSSLPSTPLSFYWSAWERKENKQSQLMTILLSKENFEEEEEEEENSTSTMDLTTRDDDNNNNDFQFEDLQSIVGPWLKRQQQTIAHDDILDFDDTKDLMRKLQLDWHRTIAKDLQRLQLHHSSSSSSLLSSNKYKEEYDYILSLLGRGGSLKERLHSLQEAHSVLSLLMQSQHHQKVEAEFPLEHYAAIFFPLLFPLLVPFLASWIKEYKRYKQKLKERKEKENEEQAEATTTKVEVEGEK